ncbi:MAG: hypothetical protein AB7V18_00620 [Pyrinomonadaceae bacterium]
MPINISNAKNRDAVVAMEGLMPEREVYYRDRNGDPITTRKILKSDIDHDLPQLMKRRKKLDSVAMALIKEDPEINIELFGKFLAETSRVYVSPGGIVHVVDEFEVIKDPDGTLRDRRPRRKELQNINTDEPLKWTGKYIKKEDAIHRFVFTGKKQLVHINGLTFDFLYEMAKDLEKRGSLLLVRGGEKGDQPIVMNRGGRSYNAFLEGRTKKDTYCLILHLSNMELKRPKILDGDGEKER